MRPPYVPDLKDIDIAFPISTNNFEGQKILEVVHLLKDNIEINNQQTCPLRTPHNALRQESVIPRFRGGIAGDPILFNDVPRIIPIYKKVIAELLFNIPSVQSIANAHRNVSRSVFTSGEVIRVKRTA